MVASLTEPTMVGIGGKGAATLAEASAFVSRFQGGMRVTSADVDGDGYCREHPIGDRTLRRFGVVLPGAGSC